jgi:hypothetical protein
MRIDKGLVWFVGYMLFIAVFAIIGLFFGALQIMALWKYVFS